MNITIYTSPTCGPCKKIKPLLFRAAVERDWIVEEVDVTTEDYPEWVTSVPTIHEHYSDNEFVFVGTDEIMKGLGL